MFLSGLEIITITVEQHSSESEKINITISVNSTIATEEFTIEIHGIIGKGVNGDIPASNWLQRNKIGHILSLFLKI